MTRAQDLTEFGVAGANAGTLHTPKLTCVPDARLRGHDLR